MTSARDCILYARFSSEKQNPKSCEDQLREARNYAATQGWRQVREFADHAISGRKSRIDRSGWDGLLALCENRGLRRGGVVLMWDLNRWSRDYPDGMIEALRLTQVGVSLADTKDGVFDQATTVGRLMLALKMGGSDEYLHDMVRAVKRGLDAKRASGFWTWPAPYGYRLAKTPGGSVLEAVPGEAAQVRRIFELIAGGATPAAVARALNVDGLRTRRGNPWGPYSVRQLCGSVCYLGKIGLYAGRHRENPHRDQPTRIIEGMHLPIVDAALWERARQRLLVVPRGPNGRTCRPLSGLVVCGSCGRRAHVSGGDDRYRYYRCPTRDMAVADCQSRRQVRVGDLEDAVRAWVRDMAGDTEALELAAASASQALLEERQRAAAAAGPVEQEIHDLEHQQERLLQALFAGNAPALINERLAQVENQLVDARGRLSVAGGAGLARLDHLQLAAAVRDVILSTEFDLADIRGFVERITLPEDPAGQPVLLACGVEWPLAVVTARKVRSDKGTARGPRKTKGRR